MAGRKKRGLRDDEKELWARVTDSATPLVAPGQRPNPLIVKEQSTSDIVVSDPIPPFRVGSKVKRNANSTKLIPAISEELSRAPVQMDRKAYGKMKAGKLIPEGRIDLHGLTLDRAHPRLNGFIMDAYASGKRLVLVITGKGKAKDDGGPIPMRLGVLRHQVPIWLSQGALKPIVMQVTPANQRHGGIGAYYVYLRRPR